jgi:lysozyme
MDLTSQLIRDEGVKRFPYRDSVGKITIGVGRNLDDVGVSPDEINLLLSNDIKAAGITLASNFPWTEGLDDARKGAMLNMTFNMGIHGLSEFRDFLAKMQAGDYRAAAGAMLDSLWARQVGDRAQRLSIQIESGEWQ